MKIGRLNSLSVLLMLAMAAAFTIGSQPLHAAHVDAASCSRADVQAAIGRAPHRGRVVVPPGKCAWASGVSVIGKNITLQGAGQDATIITIHGPAVAVNLNSTGSRVTGFGFVLTAGEVFILARGQNFRVDHNRFDNKAGGFLDGVRAAGDPAHPTGVVDHNALLNARVLVIGDMSLLAHKIWSEPSTIGAPDQTGVIYVEDNTFSFSNFGNAIDANYGGRYVFRHNTLVDVYVEAHSVQGRHRGTRSWEIYNNTFTTTQDRFTGAFLRGGTGVVFNNTLKGPFTTPFVLDNVRSFTPLGIPPGACDGTLSWDGNTPDHDGWPCRDQVGRGSDSPGRFPRPQAAEPAYFWSNTRNGGPAHPVVHNCAGTIKPKGSCADIVSGRDYFSTDSTPKPGYRPFTYPHPLTAARGQDLLSTP